MNTDTKTEIKQRITIPDEIRKLGNILALNCVIRLDKDDNKGNISFSLWILTKKLNHGLRKIQIAHSGDDLIEFANGEWLVVEKY